ncbi:MAG: hypothetical protein ACR2OZ_15130 [Verrucomicrobiales bacterium]
MTKILRCVTFISVLAMARHLPAQSDNFDDGDDVGWTHYDPVAEAGGQPPGGLGSTWTVSGGTYQLSAVAASNPTAGPGRLASLRADMPYTDFCIAIDLLPGWNAKPDQAIGILARVQPGFGPGQTNGYAFSFQTEGPDVQISRLTNEVPTALAPAVTVTLDPAKTYLLVFMGDGSYLEGRIYDKMDLVHPIVIATGNDSSYPLGIAGIVVYDNGGGQGAIATFDNYQAMALTGPPLEISHLGPDGFLLSWPAAPRCYKLQASTTLAAAQWVDIQPNLVYLSENWFFHQDISVGNTQRFYRLARTTP